MNLLAIDTSSNACSVAVTCGDEVIEKHVVEPREHTRILMPMIRELLQASNLDIAELDYVVLGNGPGSFIGMRIGASVAQGIAHASGAGLIPVSSLAAIAAEAQDRFDADQVVVAQDARMGEVYLGRYRVGARGLPEPLADEIIVPVGAVSELAGHWTAAGAAWRQIPALHEANRDRVANLVDIDFPRSLFVLRLGVASVDLAISPAELVPAYLRSKVAERPD
jgi:tRNA threonylcarbamoyladenosine biosynthesis protein TsaB